MVVDDFDLPVVVVVDPGLPGDAPEPPGDVVPADVRDRVVVVVLDDFGRVVVVDVVVPLVVVVVDFDVVAVDPDDRVVVVVALVVDFVVGFVVGLVVDVVAFGTLASSLAGVSSRAGPGAPAAAGGGGDPGGGGIRSSRRAYCMIRAKTGAETWPP